MHTAPPPLAVSPSRHTHKVRIGQKFLLYAILINVAVYSLGALLKDQITAPLLGIFILLALTALILGITGVLKMGAGFRYSLDLRVALALLSVVPVVNLIVLFVLNAKATSMLRTAGYKVGLLGAKSSRA